MTAKSYDKPSKVCVIGLGHIGLPHALLEADCGNIVWGFDSNQGVIDRLQNRQSSFFEPGLDELLNRTVGHTFFPTTNLKQALLDAEIVVIAITTGTLNEPGNLDLSNIYSTIAQIADHGIQGKTIILRPTLPLGTTEAIRNHLEQGSKLKCDIDFHIVFCPERLAEGKAIQEEQELPKVIGACCEDGYELARQYFQNVSKNIIRLRDAKTAEMVKLIDNAYRSTLFAFSNDLALLAEHWHIDVTEAIQAANYNYPRNNVPLPSCGVSGYCLSKDPYILEKAFEQIGTDRGFRSVWYYGRLTNDYMPKHVADIALKLLQTYVKGKGEYKCLICGITFKEDVDDIRFSHGIEICQNLLDGGQPLKIAIYDPFVNKEQLYKSFPSQMRNSINVYDTIDRAFEQQDCAIFTVKHKKFIDLRGDKILTLISRMGSPRIIIDGWNIYPELKRNTSLIYQGIGNA